MNIFRESIQNEPISWQVKAVARRLHYHKECIGYYSSPISSRCQKASRDVFHIQKRRRKASLRPLQQQIKIKRKPVRHARKALAHLGMFKVKNIYILRPIIANWHLLCVRVWCREAGCRDSFEVLYRHLFCSVFRLEFAPSCLNTIPSILATFTSYWSRLSPPGWVMCWGALGWWSCQLRGCVKLGKRTSHGSYPLPSSPHCLNSPLHLCRFSLEMVNHLVEMITGLLMRVLFKLL